MTHPMPTLDLSPLQTVLMTTDFSPLANRALYFAARLVPTGGTVVVLAIQHPRALSDTEYENGLWAEESKVQHEQHLKRCRERLEALTLPIAADRKIETKLIVAWNVAEEICTFAAQRKVDAVCLSSHGYTGFRASLLGSVAQAVVTRCPCPVMLVRGEG